MCDVDLSKGEEAETEVFPGTKLRIVHSMDMGGLFMVHLEEIEIPTELMQ